MPHSFHIPVMGSGFTIDTALKVSQYGIDSALSLVDDVLMEKMRKYYCFHFGFEYSEIPVSDKKLRAERITAYLNTLDIIAEKQFAELRNEVMTDPVKALRYFHIFPDDSYIKKEGEKFLRESKCGTSEYKEWVLRNIRRGGIDVNIMTKLDRQTFVRDEALSAEYRDAHAAVRGFASSRLRSSLVLSAGLSPELYGYLAEFCDFLPDSNGELKKKIIVKVSDYRSASVQGKFLAKKGIWVSGFRVESGLNCGGHAFATDGHLLGPILAEFRDKKDELIRSMHDIYIAALKDGGYTIPEKVLPVMISAQGGVGTSDEHDFLISYYKLDSVGWGTPFLLVPEVVNIDEYTLGLLSAAGEDDVYLSNTSPLQIPFYSLKGNTRDAEKQKRIDAGRPGVKCPRKYLALNREFSSKGLCMASSEYQQQKLKQLEELGLNPEEFKLRYDDVTAKTCICVGLGTSVLINKGIDYNEEGPGVAVCPSPTIAYFSRISTLYEMADHIYGRVNLIERKDRPLVFIKELGIYIEYLKQLVTESKQGITKKQLKQLQTMSENIRAGLMYYIDLFGSINAFECERLKALKDFISKVPVVEEINKEIANLKLSAFSI